VILLRHARRAARDPAAFVQTVAANLISAAVRLIPLGQTAGLRVLVALINLAGVADLRHRFPALDLILIESGGDNLAATFSPELADLTIYVIDVSAGDNPPRKGGPGITRSDLLVINKIDLAPYVGANLDVMDRDARKMRGERPFVFINIRAGTGVEVIAGFIERQGGLTPR